MAERARVHETNVYGRADQRGTDRGDVYHFGAGGSVILNHCPSARPSTGITRTL